MKKILILLFVITISSYAQWVQISTVSTSQLNAVKFFDQFTGIVAGSDGIWRSTNSGVNWSSSLAGISVNAMAFSDINNGLVACNGGLIYKTTNGGIAWSFANNSFSDNLYAIQWANASVCYAVGQSGRIMKSGNGGTGWSSLTSPFTEDLKGVYMDPLNGYIAGGSTHEIVAITVNGGSTWQTGLNQSGNYLNAITSLPTNFLTSIVVGSNGIILKSTNFANSWIPKPSGVTQELNSVYFIDGLIGYVSGNVGTILMTTNAGSNWATQPTGTTENLRNISFINSTIGWAVGQNGIVLRTGIPVSISQITTETPKQFQLFQNYPNPFNPSTQIRFEINRSTNVTIRIYNAIGKFLEEILNEFKPIGRYYVMFYANNFPSGLYFYKIESGNLSETKRMLLLK